MDITWHNEKRAIKDLVPYVANPRQITEKQAKDLKASLERFGVADPIIINTDNTIIGGHQRKKILETLMGVDSDFEIDVRVPDRELSIDEARELNVRLNKNLGEFDYDILANNFELDDLLDWGFEKSDLDIDLWMPEQPDDAEPQIDRAEELREVWGVETGQLWQLGEHRLICGDCTDAGIIERLMQGEKADMVFTDPPYGMNLDTDYSGMVSKTKEGQRGQKFPEVIGDDEDYDPQVILDMFSYVKEVFMWGGDYYVKRLPDDGSWFVWDKRLTENFDRMYGSAFELCWSKQKHKREIVRVKWANCFGTETQDIKKRVHPTQKPIEVCEFFIDKFGDKKSLIFDGFLGSGTTLIACERLNRKCRAVEISPAYVAVAIQRWVDVTGGEPELVSE